MNDDIKNTNTEDEQKPKVMTTRELVWEADIQVAHAHDALVEYERSRASHATEEQKANEGRHGRNVLKHIDEAHKLLTQMRMRVNLQLEGRDSARARQLDRILGIAEEPLTESTMQERVGDLRAHTITHLEQNLDVPPGSLGGRTT